MFAMFVVFVSLCEEINSSVEKGGAYHRNCDATGSHSDRRKTLVGLISDWLTINGLGQFGSWLLFSLVKCRYAAK